MIKILLLYVINFKTSKIKYSKAMKENKEQKRFD